jgi:hypothetical protein
VPLLAKLVMRSGNAKLGGMPASSTSRVSCPTRCSFYGKGCFAEQGHTAFHWRDVGTKGDDWTTFCRKVRTIPRGQTWRHNVAGDLPMDPRRPGRIDANMLGQLVAANRGKRGFTFTHHAIDDRDSSDSVALPSLWNRTMIGAANAMGFTVNLSADSLEQADAYAKLGCGPVVVVIPSTAPVRLKTPEGRRVTVCPAETEARLTCSECELCMLPGRKAIIGFRAHGNRKAIVDDLVQLRKKPTEARASRLE